MTLEATRPTRVGELIKHEYGLEHGYARTVKELTVALDASIGEVYADDGTITVAADVAALAEDGTTPLYILVDDNIYMDGHGAASTADYVCLTGGPGGSGAAVVMKDMLKFGDTLSANQINTVVGVLESQGIKVSPDLV